MRSYHETDDFGISYVMWYCRRCNTMCTDTKAHNEKYHPERNKKSGQA